MQANNIFIYSADTEKKLTNLQSLRNEQQKLAEIERNLEQEECIDDENDKDETEPGNETVQDVGAQNHQTHEEDCHEGNL